MNNEFAMYFYIVTTILFFAINLFDMIRFQKLINTNIMELETAHNVMIEVEDLVRDNKLLIKDATNLMDCANAINSKISALYKINPTNEAIIELHKVMALEVEQYRKRQQI